MRTTDVLKRFEDNTKLRFKPGSPTPGQYARAFRRFSDSVKLESYSRRQLSGPTGKKFLMDYLSAMRRGHAEANQGRETRTWVWNLKAMECVWMNGLGIAWPIDPKRDLGKMPPIMRRDAPRNEDIKPFAEALKQEPNPQRRLLIRLMLTYGWRPNQIQKLRWRNLQYDHTGRLYALVAKEAFKTFSDIVAYTPPAVAEDIEAVRTECPDTTPEAPLFLRPAWGKYPARGHSTDSIEDAYARFKEDHRIESKLIPMHFRHWVKRMGRKRLSDEAILAYWQGHDTKSENRGMSGHYGTSIPIDEVIGEQAREWPDGPLGDILPPDIKAESTLPPEAVRIVTELMAGRLSDIDAAQLLGKLRVAAIPDLLKR